MKEQIRDLCAKAEADYCEIRIEDSRKTAIRFQGKDLEEVEQSRLHGGNVRACVNGTWGFVTFNNLDELESRVKEAVDTARAASKHSNEKSRLAPVDPVEDTVRLSLKEDPREIALADKIALFAGYNDRMLSKEGIKSTGLRYFDTFTNLLFANSEGTLLDRDIMDMGMGGMAMAVHNGVTSRSSASAGGRDDFGVFRGLESDFDKAAEDAIGNAQSEVVKGGSYTVVCDPNLAGVFVHEAFGHLSEGDNVAEDPRMQEILTLGRKFGGEYLHIYDTGLDTGLRGHLKYDDEGVPTEHTDLIKDGELVGRLHSRETAGLMGERATGNGRAMSYLHPPIPRMRNTCIANGPHGSLDDLVKDIPLGVYAMDAFGGQTNGELFTFTAGQAFMIRDGKIAERVRDVTLSGNVFDTLKNIDGVGNDYGVHDGAGGCGKAGQFPLPVSHGSPHIRIQDVVIGGN